MNILLAVHAGAGSYGNDRSHRKTLLTACRNAVKSGIANDDSLEACVKAVQVLELSSATNAAIGSNLTIDGTVECDAAVMQSTGMQFASVGAVSTVRNPIRLAQKLLLAQANDDGYLVRPTLLVGCGAEQFARQVGGIEMIADSRELITTRATDEHSMALIRYRNQKLEDISTRLDTVGGVSIGRDGRAFAAVSSGGLLLKHCGRVGHGPIFGAGIWAEQRQNLSVAVSVSGCGEYLMRTHFAEMLGSALLDHYDDERTCVETAIDTYRKYFIESRILADVDSSRKLVGALALLVDVESKRGELIWLHNTRHFAIAYGGGDGGQLRSFVSDLDNCSVMTQSVLLSL